jgi:hypothetical protein
VKVKGSQAESTGPQRDQVPQIQFLLGRTVDPQSGVVSYARFPPILYQNPNDLTRVEGRFRNPGLFKVRVTNIISYTKADSSFILLMVDRPRCNFWQDVHRVSWTGSISFYQPILAHRHSCGHHFRPDCLDKCDGTNYFRFYISSASSNYSFCGDRYAMEFLPIPNSPTLELEGSRRFTTVTTSISTRGI